MIANYAPATERLSRAAWSRLLWWRFRLFQRHRHKRLVVEHIGGRQLVVLPDVINPKLFRTGQFLGDSLHGVIRPGTTVLDMGTGSGIGAIVAAGLGARVTAVDINPEAVRCARINALVNRVDDRVEVRQGDLFEPVSGEQFDVVVFNPPYLAGRPSNALDHAFRGDDVVGRFAREVERHLAPEGFALVLLSTDANVAALLATFQAARLMVSPLSERNLRNEVLTIYRVVRGDVEGSRE
jgi:HemK-related putative methylase